MLKHTYSVQGRPDETARHAATDIAQTFDDAVYTMNGRPAIAAVLTCETHDIRFCLGGSTPTQGATGLGHILYVGQSLRLANPYAIRTFSFINAVNLDQGFFQLTCEYEGA